MDANSRSDLSAPEECCMCDFVFGYPKSLDINAPERLGNYVEGIGQLCPVCGKEILHPAQVIPLPLHS